MKPLRIAIAQANPTVGDYAGNTRKILNWIRLADRNKADLIVFSELSLSGYPVWDLAHKKEFIDAGLAALEKIRKATAKNKIAVALGFIDRGKAPSGRSRNALAWIERGKIRAKYYKQLLPTYDVFLEELFFEPGTESALVDFHGRKMGLTICEDIWDDRYSRKPLAHLKKKGADFFINISSSPYYRGVAEVRRELLLRHAQTYRTPILYVNQVGAQDDLIFDGRSFFVDGQGRTLFQAPSFEEGFHFFDWDPRDKQPAVCLPGNSDTPEQIYEALKLGIRDYCRKNRFKKVLIGLSGGIDSALVATLAVDALGKDAVTGMTMPGPYSSKGSWADSEALAKNLGIEFRVCPIKEIYEFIKSSFPHSPSSSLPAGQAGGNDEGHDKPTLALENLQARLRGLQLMYVSNDEGKLVLTTGNKSEIAMGYCTLYGDMAGGLAVIGDLYKTDVYRLAWWRNEQARRKGEREKGREGEDLIPKAILLKAPSAELRPNQKDEDSLPPYEILDRILYFYIEKNLSPEEITNFICQHRDPSAFGLRMTQMKRLVKEVIRKVDHNEYKRRQTPPILRVTRKAWFGRRMPITNRFQC